MGSLTVFVVTLVALGLGVYAGRAVVVLLAAMDARRAAEHREDAPIDLGVPAGVEVSRWTCPVADDPRFDPDPDTPIFNDVCYTDAKFLAKMTDFDAELRRLNREFGL